MIGVLVGVQDCGVGGVEDSAVADSLVVLGFANRGPGLAGDLCWRMGFGLMSGDAAVAVIVDHFRREYPWAFSE